MPHLPKDRFSKKIAKVQPIDDLSLTPDQRNKINDALHIYNHQPSNYSMLMIINLCNQFGCPHPPEFDAIVKEFVAQTAKAVSDGFNPYQLRNIVVGQSPSGEPAPQAHARAVVQLRNDRTINAAVATAELTNSSLEPALQVAADRTGLVYETVEALYNRQDREAFAFDVTEVRINLDEAA